MGVHENVRPYECDSCEKGFRTRSELKRHTESVHEKIRNVECSNCEKTFCSKSKLKRHTAKVHEKKIISNVIFVIHLIITNLALTNIYQIHMKF